MQMILSTMLVLAVCMGIKMNILLTPPTDVVAPEAVAPLGNPMIPMVLYLAFIFVFIYFIILRPQKKERKKAAAMLSSLEIGDSVLTNSGFYGTIIDITDDTVIIEFGNNKNCRIPMQKAAIAQIEKPDAE